MANWGEIRQEIDNYRQQNPQDAQSAFDVVRRKHLDNLHRKTGRNTIAYYSGWLSKPGVAGTEINDEDKNGFMNAIHRLDRSTGLDILLHTPGGNIAATQSIVDYLHRMFGKNIRAIIPQIALSAGTMIACSCKSIVMGLQSNIGPIDPQVRDIPAYGVIEEFRRAFREVKRDPGTIPIWQTIIGQYRPTFLSQCQNAVTWSNSFVREQLRLIMFDGDKEAGEKARSIVAKLSAYSANRTHNRHIHVDECEQIGLEIERLEEDNEFQDLVLSVHHCFMLTLANTTAHKIIENHLGNAMVKHSPRQAVSVVPQIIQQPVPRSP